MKKSDKMRQLMGKITVQEVEKAVVKENVVETQDNVDLNNDGKVDEKDVKIAEKAVKEKETILSKIKKKIVKKKD